MRDHGEGAFALRAKRFWADSMLNAMEESVEARLEPRGLSFSGPTELNGALSRLEAPTEQLRKRLDKADVDARTHENQALPVADLSRHQSDEVYAQAWRDGMTRAGESADPGHLRAAQPSSSVGVGEGRRGIDGGDHCRGGR
jgi:hypothetical protein